MSDTDILYTYPRDIPHRNPNQTTYIDILQIFYSEILHRYPTDILHRHPNYTTYLGILQRLLTQGGLTLTSGTLGHTGQAVQSTVPSHGNFQGGLWTTPSSYLHHCISTNKF